MKTRWVNSAFTLGLTLSLSAAMYAQDSPELKTRSAGDASNQQPTQAATPPVSTAPPNAIPEGTRFIIKLKDTLDTSKMEQGKRFKAELREDLIAPSGELFPKGRSVKGHIGSFERGYTGARLLLVMDEIEGRKGWAPLVATVTGVPGDRSIKSADNEGELSRKGPDKKRAIENAAIGAGIGAVAGAAAGGGKGAAIGAIAGAGLGTGAGLLIKGQDLKLAKDTQLEVRLDRDLVVPTH
ncbi:MAG TPA: hypothetical protein VKZ53_16545 [Candidatus Angelobacter sp.]|nr:hypothetical protein [Candidatus Angelobacter sp.]